MRKLAIILIIAFLYAAMAKMSQYLSSSATLVAPVWPPAGIALAAILVFGNIALFGIFIGCFLSNFHMFSSSGMTLTTILYACIPALGGTLQAFIGKAALEYFSFTTDIFKNIRSILVFIFISAFAACLINATLGTFAIVYTGNIPFVEFSYAWLTWWIADAVGVVTITSTLIAWIQNRHEKFTYFQLIKLILTWISLFIVGYVASHSQLELTYLFIPFAIWSAFQFEKRLSLITGIFISLVCIYGTSHGYGIIHANSIDTAISLIQVFICIIFLTILLIDVILSERQKAYNDLQLLNRQLETRVQDRTKDLSHINEQLQIQKNKAIEAFESLKQSHARLIQSEKMASLGVLTAGVAHEIKHPLNAISANMQAIKKLIDQIMLTFTQEDTDKNLINNINCISEQIFCLITATNEGIKRTAGIIADLTNFARADEMEMAMSDLHQNIDSTLNLLHSEMRNNIKVVKKYGEIPLLHCHPGKIKQVIMNILVNAIHALQSQPESEITIHSEYQDDLIVLSIKDNGPGIKKEVLEKLFTPFFTTKQTGTGSGLGLFLSYNIIREHNGSITVNSELNKGTEFIITLPTRGSGC